MAARKKPSIFISHKSRIELDDRVASMLARDLGKLCDRVYLDSNQSPGTEIEEAIIENLDSADFVIALISAEANKSEWVKTELERAVNCFERLGRPRIIPVRLGYEGQFDPRIATCITRFGEIRWDGNDYATFLGWLTSAIGVEQGPVVPSVSQSKFRRVWFFLPALLALTVSLLLINHFFFQSSDSQNVPLNNPHPTPGQTNTLDKSSGTKSDPHSAVNESSPIGTPLDSILEALSVAHEDSRLGTSQNDERALQQYRATYKQLSPKVRAALNQNCAKLLADAEADYNNNHADDALIKYDKFFLTCLRRQVQN
jgi:hypothetical protein